MKHIQVFERFYTPPLEIRNRLQSIVNLLSHSSGTIINYDTKRQNIKGYHKVK